MTIRENGRCAQNFEIQKESQMKPTVTVKELTGPMGKMQGHTVMVITAGAAPARRQPKKPKAAAAAASGASAKKSKKADKSTKVKKTAGKAIPGARKREARVLKRTINKEELELKELKRNLDELKQLLKK